MELQKNDYQEFVGLGKLNSNLASQKSSIL